MTGRGRRRAGSPERPAAGLREPLRDVTLNSLTFFLIAVFGGLASLSAVLAGAGMVAGPLCLALIGTFLFLGIHTGARLCLAFTWTWCACARAERFEDLLLVAPTKMKLAGLPPGPERDIDLSRRDHDDFWRRLGDAEQKDLLSRGERRVFRAGSVLFHEGEPAKEVAIILKGRTKVCVQKDGRERLVAVRGPGQLIGERAALKHSVRSASVVALERVEVLMVGTAAFSAFLGRYGHVVDMIEGQLFERLAEPAHHPCPCGDAPAGLRDVPVGLPDATEPAPVPARPRLEGEHCTVVFLDVANFAAAHRNEEDRGHIRFVLRDLVRTAFEKSGLGDLDGHHWEDRGDGFLIVVRPEVPTETVLGDLVPRMEAPLQRHNRRSTEPVCFKLRVAVDAGPVKSDASGVCGETIIRAARIVDVDAFKESLEGSAGCLGVIVSSNVFDGVVAQNRDALRQDEYREVHATVKESAVNAHMRLTAPLLAPAPS